MYCDFRTNIDCATKFMTKLQGVPDIQPNVGDEVLVYKNDQSEVWMKVVSRRWVLATKGIRLICELHLTSWHENIPAFEQFLKSRNLHW